MDFELIIFLIIMLIVFVPVLSVIENFTNIDNYPISEAILINDFISYTRAGNPCYFLVYEFNDGSIKQFNVNVEQYYKLTNKKEGS